MMQEIRFRASEEQLIKEMKEMSHSVGCQWRDRCDDCKRWGQGFYNVSTGEFVCLNCIAKKRWLEMVGNPSEYA